MHHNKLYIATPGGGSKVMSVMHPETYLESSIILNDVYETVHAVIIVGQT